MLGIIFIELKKFVLAAAGPAGWNAIVKEAGVAPRAYETDKTYPDSELVALAVAGSKVTKIPLRDLLRAYGEFIAPDLISLFRAHVHPSWKTLDLIEHTEPTIHRLVRAGDPNASPPRILTQRIGPKELQLIYESKRNLCDVAKGIAVGAAKHYGEALLVQEQQCMHEGATRCQIRLTVEGPSGARPGS